MSAGLVPIDVAISAPATTQATSGLNLSTLLNFNPGFLIGSGTLDNSPSGSPGSSASGTLNPGQDAPSSAFASPQPAGQGYSTLNTLLPTAAGAQAAPSSSLIVWLLIGGVLLVVLSGGKK